MQQRPIGPFKVSPIGLGCMNLSHAYGAPPGAEEGARLLLRALDALINQHTVHGPRYSAATQAEIDSEEFA